MKQAWFVLSLCGVLYACTNQPGPGILLQVDRSFSDYSVKSGFTKAFLDYGDDSLVLLRPASLPIIGKQSLVELYKNVNDSLFHLSWKPSKAYLAKSGELGYTYGLYTFIRGNDTTRGTYLTIWRKNKKGDWKYVLDTGNEGLAPE